MQVYVAHYVGLGLLYFVHVIIWYTCAIVAAIIAAALVARTASEQQRLAERRWKRQHPEPLTTYDRFNTQSERTTHVRVDGATLYLTTDLQRVTCEADNLLLEIGSQLELFPLRIELALTAFSDTWLRHNGGIDERGLRHVGVAGTGWESSVLIGYLNELLFLKMSQDLAARSVQLRVIRMRREPNTARIQCYGLLPNDDEFDFWFDTAAFRLGVSLPVRALQQLEEADGEGLAEWPEA